MPWLREPDRIANCKLLDDIDIVEWGSEPVAPDFVSLIEKNNMLITNKEIQDHNWKNLIQDTVEKGRMSKQPCEITTKVSMYIIGIKRTVLLNLGCSSGFIL